MNKKFFFFLFLIIILNINLIFPASIPVFEIKYAGNLWGDRTDYTLTISTADIILLNHDTETIEKLKQECNVLRKKNDVLKKKNAEEKNNILSQNKNTYSQLKHILSEKESQELENKIKSLEMIYEK